MCGIFGHFARSGEPLDCERLAGLTNMLRHRGPDGGAYWADEHFFLGHRRLSIIDLSTGAQPMATADGRLVITYNGEIYNYVELRAELVALGHTFRTTSDTEVLLHGYRAWGEELLPKVRGMFAFGLVDREAGTLLLARDRFGEKPLFVCEHRGGITFASEVRPIAAMLGASRELDGEALSDYLCFNYVPGHKTLVKSITRLPPGSTRTYTRTGVTTGTYWTIRSGSPPSSSCSVRGEKEAIAELQTSLDDAVRLAMRSDVPVALFLSGGIDSSLVAESATRQGGLKEAFCVDIQEKSFSEWSNADWVARRLGLTLHRVVLSPDAVEEVCAIAAHADDPLGDASAVAVWALARETARQFKVVVTGDGGDELFGGYVTYKATALHRQLVAHLPQRLRTLMAANAGRLPIPESKVGLGYKLMRFLRAADLPSGQAHFTWNGSFLPSAAARLLNADADKRAAREATMRMSSRHAFSQRLSLDELTRADLSDYLANDILVKTDRMTMAHGLESRAPFLDKHFASFALRTTPSFEGALWQQPKRLLRQLAAQVLGERVSAAKKQGFSIPIHKWLRARGKDLVGDLLSLESVRAVPLLDAEEVLRTRDRFLVGHEPLGFEIWGLMILTAWYRARFQTQEPPADTELRRVTFATSKA